MKVGKNKNPLFSWDAIGTEKGAAKAIKDIIEVFEKAGNGVVPEDSTSQSADLTKIKTESGVKYRELNVHFKDSQSVVFRFNSTGDIYKVKINGKETPIANQDDHKAAIAEIIGKLNKGRVAFNKRLAKRADPTPTPSTPRTTTTKKVQIEQLTSQRDSLKSKIDGIDGQITAMRDEMGANGSGKKSGSDADTPSKPEKQEVQKKTRYELVKESEKEYL